MQEEIVKEIHSVVGRNDEPITLTHIQEFKFTERVIKETMRLYSPTPFFERILEHDEIIGTSKSFVSICLFILIFKLFTI